MFTVVALVVAFGAGYVYGKEGKLDWKTFVASVGAVFAGFWDQVSSFFS